MVEHDGLICACVLDGNGGGKEIGWAEIRAWRSEQGILWVHLDRTGNQTVHWIQEESGIDPIIREALLSTEVRPRELQMNDALLLILRGVNLNPGADPEDMVGLRMWFEPRRIVTLRYRRVMAVQDVRDSLLAGTGPRTVGAFMARVAGALIERMGPVVSDLDDHVDELENEVVTAQSAVLRSRLADVRQTAISLRRYLAPQRDVMARLAAQQIEWQEPFDKAVLREISDRTTRYVEDLDAARERAAVIQDELGSRLSDQLNRTMYLLTLVATLLLPPSLLTGLLGINVGGIPGAETPWAFYFVGAIIIVIGVVEILLLRRLKWL